MQISIPLPKYLLVKEITNAVGVRCSLNAEKPGYAILKPETISYNNMAAMAMDGWKDRIDVLVLANRLKNIIQPVEDSLVDDVLISKVDSLEHIMSGLSFLAYPTHSDFDILDDEEFANIISLSQNLNIGNLARSKPLIAHCMLDIDQIVQLSNYDVQISTRFIYENDELDSSVNSSKHPCLLGIDNSCALFVRNII